MAKATKKAKSAQPATPAGIPAVVTAVNGREAELIPLVSIFPELRARLDKWIGPESPYQVAAKALADHESLRSKLEARVEFEAKKLSRLLGITAGAELAGAMAVEWYDDDLRGLIENFCDVKQLTKLREQGARNEDLHGLMEDLEDRLNNSEQNPSDPLDGCASFGGLVFDPSYGFVERDRYLSWQARGRPYIQDFAFLDYDCWDNSAQACDAIRRVMQIPTPEEVAHRKAQGKRAAKSSASELKAVDRGFQKLKGAVTKSAAAKPSKIRNVDKGKELAQLAKSEKPAAKSAPKAPASKAIKALNVSVLGPCRFKINYRQGDSGRSMEVESGTAGDAAAEAASRLGITPGTFAIAYKNCTAASTGGGGATLATPPAPDTAPEAESKIRVRAVADGHYIVAKDGRWFVERVNDFEIKDSYSVGHTSAVELEDAIRTACRILTLDPRGLRVIDNDGQILEGTAADLLKAEAAADAPSEEELEAHE